MYHFGDDCEYFEDEEDLLESVLENLNNLKNHAMIRQLLIDAGSNYIEEEGLTKLKYYSDNLARIDSLKTFIDDEAKGLMSAALSTLYLNCSKVEAILRYIMDHENVEFHQDNVVRAACRVNAYIFFKMIEAGANVHHAFSISGFTALHVAVVCNRKNIVKYLLDQNVDVNCCNEYNRTPLHYAFIEDVNLDIIELLIQKGADVYLRDMRSTTPLEYGIICRHFNNVSSVLNFTQTENIITYDLLKKLFYCFCRNDADDENDFLRRARPKRIYYDFFKCLYKKLVEKFIPNHNTEEYPLLSMYLKNHVFDSAHYTSALIVILKSKIASRLLEECLAFEQESSVYDLLIRNLIWANVEQVEDRLKLFNCLLSLKMRPNLKDMGLILSNYRFEEEFKLLSKHLREDSLINNYNKKNPIEYLACIFCGLEDDLDYNAIFSRELSEDFFDYIKQYFTPALSNCSTKNRQRNKPNILPLREIIRNSARKFIKKTNKILSPEDFNFAVQSMLIPLEWKNFILLLSTVQSMNFRLD